MKEKVNIDLLSDQAITSLSDDKFERKDFVDSIAEIIYSQSTKVNPNNIKDFKNIEENMIIGLYGSWGFGKSSILNLLKENLEKRHLETIYFNPWMYGSEEQLLISLFNTIVEKSGLDDKDKTKLIELFNKYLPLISIVSEKFTKNVEAILKVVGDNSDIVNASYCKTKIDEILLNKANPITIFIDDVDRLSKNEIHILFKTLRLIASFKHIIYVVACDFDMVAKSIKENYVNGGIEDGRSFIDKIIQIPIRIPEIKPQALYDYALSYIKITCNITNLEQNQIFREILEAFFHTPRDIKRFINGFRFTQNYLKNCIEPIDLIILELIRVKLHGLYEIIRIYYFSIKHLNTEENYRFRVSEYFRSHKPEYFDSTGQLRNSNREYNLYNKIFSTLFGTQILNLEFYFNSQLLSYSIYLNNSDIKHLKNLKNPKVLVNYFEKSNMTNIET